MEYIKIQDNIYKINLIKFVSNNLLSITFENEIPEDFSKGFSLYTSGDVLCHDFSDFITIYKESDKTLILSNDGSVYVQPTTPDADIPPVIDPYYPTLEEIKASKKYEINIAGRQAIINGYDVAISDGQTLHFTLKEEDQIGFLACQASVINGDERISWHATGDVTLPCQYFSNSDMKLILEKAVLHRTFHQTYCNNLKLWIDNCTSQDEISEIFYGIDIPEEYHTEVYKDLLTKKHIS